MVIGPTVQVVMLRWVGYVGERVPERHPREDRRWNAGLLQALELAAVPRWHFGWVEVAALPVGACDVLLMQEYVAGVGSREVGPRVRAGDVAADGDEEHAPAALWDAAVGGVDFVLIDAVGLPGVAVDDSLVVMVPEFVIV